MDKIWGITGNNIDALLGRWFNIDSNKFSIVDIVNTLNFNTGIKKAAKKLLFL